MEQDEMWLELPTGTEHITRHNTELFRYIGSSSLLGEHDNYNHIEITSIADDGELEGCAVIFQDNDNYEDLTKFIVRHKYPQHFNLSKISKFVQYAFDATHGIDEDQMTFPERWLEDNGTA